MYVKTNLRYYHKFGQIHTDKTAAWFHQWIFLIWGLGPLCPLTVKKLAVPEKKVGILAVGYKPIYIAETLDYPVPDHTGPSVIHGRYVCLYI